jgi:hypothetical protein
MEIEEFSNKYLAHEIYWKKILALKNYAESLNDFKDWWILEICLMHLESRFLDKKLELVLDYLIEESKINFLDWCAKNASPLTNTVKIEESSSGQYYLRFEEVERKRRDDWKNSLAPLKLYPHKYAELQTGTVI